MPLAHAGLWLRNDNGEGAVKEQTTWRRWIFRRSLPLCTLLGLLFTVSCSTGLISYEPPLVPIALTVDTRGHVSIETGASITTPIGRFSARVAKELNPEDGYTNVVIEHANGEADVFQIHSTETLYISIDGQASVVITDRKAIITARSGTATTITIATDPIIEHDAQVSAPELKLSESSTAAHGSVTATAAGFAAGEKVRFSWNGPTSGTIGGYPANSQGTVSVDLHADEEDPPGDYVITATGLTSGRVASARLQIVKS